MLFKDFKCKDRFIYSESIKDNRVAVYIKIEPVIIQNVKGLVTAIHERSGIFMGTTDDIEIIALY